MLPDRAEIVIRALRTRAVFGGGFKDSRIRELAAVVQKRFGFPHAVELYAEKVCARERRAAVGGRAASPSVQYYMGTG